MNKHFAFRCMGCGLVHVIDKSNSDGHICKKCSDPLVILDKAVIVSRDKNNNNLVIDVEVNMSQIDEALDKAETLKNILEKINRLVEC